MTTTTKASYQNNCSVFISYKHGAAEAYVESLHETLEQQGCEVWRDKQDIPNATAWLKEIYKGIDQCLVFIAIGTHEYICSKYCHWEMHRAIQAKKKIVTIIIQRDFAKGSWDHLQTCYDNIGPDDFNTQPNPQTDYYEVIQSRQYIESRSLTSHQSGYTAPYGISGTDIIALKPHEDDIKRIVKAIEEDHDYLYQHTIYYLMAMQYKENLGSLLSGEALEKAQEWKSENVHKNPALSDIHISFFDDSLVAYNESLVAQARRRRTILRAAIGVSIVLGVLALIAAILAIFANQESNRANTEAANSKTQEAIAIYNQQESNSRLQTLAMVDNALIITVGQRPSRPLITEKTVWITNRQDDTVEYFSLGTGSRIGEPIAVGSRPLEPVSDGEYLWIGSVDARTITRIQLDNPQTSALTIDIGDIPQQIFATSEQWIWVVSNQAFIQIDRRTGTITKQVQSNDNSTLQNPSFDGHFIWALSDSRSNYLYRIDANTGEQSGFSITEPADTPLHAFEFMWLPVGNDLLKVRPTSLEVVAIIPLNGHSRSLIADDSNYLWAVVNDSINKKDRVVAIDAITHEQTVALEYEIGLAGIYWADNTLIATTKDGQVIAYDIQQRERLWITALQSSANLSPPTFDSDHLWLSDIDGRTIYVINVQNGRVVRRLPVCTKPTQARFDGANMWISCHNNVESAEKGSLTRVAAFQFYHGVGEGQVGNIAEFETNSRPHRPIYDGQQLWVIQEVDGVLIVIDLEEECVVGTYELGAYPDLPIYNAETRQLWIEGQTRQSGTDLDFQVLGFSVGTDRECSPTPIRPTYTATLPTEPGIMNLIDNELWIDLSTGFLSLSDVLPDIGFIDTQSLETILDSQNILSVDGIITGFVEDSRGRIWISAVEESNGRLWIVEKSTHTVEDSVVLAYAPWSVAIENGKVWVTSGFEGGYANLGLGLGLKGALYRFVEQEIFLEFARSLSRPMIAGGYIWISYSNAPPVLTAQYSRSQSDLMVLDPSNGSIIKTFDPCENILALHEDRQTANLWVVCLGVAEDPAVIQVIDLKAVNRFNVIAEYSGLGAWAWPPVELVNLDDTRDLWIVYRDSGTAARFNLETLELRQVYGLGSAPSQPIRDKQGHIWIANSGNGTIQRIVIDQQTE